jgi:imidazole glycerol-phosphate synthase subunit HisH
MSIPVTVLDYGIGNLLNVCRALEHCGATVKLVHHASAHDVDADRMVLPGVGAFGDGMAEMRARGLDDLVKRFAQTERPFLGVCVGMQMLFDSSEEMGVHQGLGLMRGQVRAVPLKGADGQVHRIPHIGWRSLHARRPWTGTALADVKPDERVYFVHSYAAVPDDESVRLADVDYDGVRLCAAVGRNNLYGCQFHPERSAAVGLGILKRFLSL